MALARTCVASTFELLSGCELRDSEARSITRDTVSLIFKTLAISSASLKTENPAETSSDKTRILVLQRRWRKMSRNSRLAARIRFSVSKDSEGEIHSLRPNCFQPRNSKPPQQVRRQTGPGKRKRRRIGPEIPRNLSPLSAPKRGERTPAPRFTHGRTKEQRCIGKSMHHRRGVKAAYFSPIARTSVPWLEGNIFLRSQIAASPI